MQETCYRERRESSRVEPGRAEPGAASNSPITSERRGEQPTSSPDPYACSKGVSTFRPPTRAYLQCNRIGDAPLLSGTNTDMPLLQAHAKGRSEHNATIRCAPAAQCGDGLRSQISSESICTYNKGGYAFCPRRKTHRSAVFRDSRYAVLARAEGQQIRPCCTCSGRGSGRGWSRARRGPLCLRQAECAMRDPRGANKVWVAARAPRPAAPLPCPYAARGASRIGPLIGVAPAARLGCHFVASCAPYRAFSDSSPRYNQACHSFVSLPAHRVGPIDVCARNKGASTWDPPATTTYLLLFNVADTRLCQWTQCRYAPLLRAPVERAAERGGGLAPSLGSGAIGPPPLQRATARYPAPPIAARDTSALSSGPGGAGRGVAVRCGTLELQYRRGLKFHRSVWRRSRGRSRPLTTVTPRAGGTPWHSDTRRGRIGVGRSQ